MMPVYNHMDTYPRQKIRMPSVHYRPNFDGIPPHMTTDQTNSPVAYEHWPHGSSYGYMVPCQGCCNHGNFLGHYNFRPPFYQFSPSSPFHCYGYHPPFAEPYPTSYPLPPHHYSMEQPRFEYEKHGHGNYHCCGCPNHPCYQRHSKDVKIEKEEPDVVKQSSPLVPAQLKNYPYPIMWVSSEFTGKNNEHKNTFESREADWEEVPCNININENLKPSQTDPRVWNGWFPLVSNSLKPLTQGENDKIKKNQQNEDRKSKYQHPIIWIPPNNNQDDAKEDKKEMDGWFPLTSLMRGEDDEQKQGQTNDDEKSHFQYPVIWLPSSSKQEEAVEKNRGKNAAPESTEEPYSSFKSVPVKPSEADHKVNGSIKNKEDSGSQIGNSPMTGNIANLVKRANVSQSKDEKVENREKKVVKYVPVKNAETNGKSTSSASSEKRKSSSPPKTSKLPPVCLRVEPLSKRKGSNGSSRSPSPPSLKRQTEETQKEISFKPSPSSDMKENSKLDVQAPNTAFEKQYKIGPSEAEGETVDMINGKASESKNDDFGKSEAKGFAVLHDDSPEEKSQKLTADTTGPDAYKCKVEAEKDSKRESDMEFKGEVEANAATDSADGKCSARTTRVSDAEAAKLIQSVFRGFEVRKYESLKKVKLMANVREQIGDVRSRIEALKSLSDRKEIDKQIVAISEMIMSLLLKLDTIQGLHPSLRDVRKTLARELVSIQEEVDSLKMKSKESDEEVAIAKLVEEPSNDANGETNMLESENMEVIVEESSCDDVAEMKKQARDGQISHMVGLEFSDQAQEIVRPCLANKEDCGSSKVEVEESAVVCDMDSAPKLVLDDETPSRVGEDTEIVQAEHQEGCGGTTDEPYVHQPLVSEQETNTEGSLESHIQDSSHNPKMNGEAEVAEKRSAMTAGDEQEGKGWRELPLEVIEEPPVLKSENDEPVGKAAVNEQAELSTSLEPVYSNEIENTVTEVDRGGVIDKVLATNSLEELPVGVIEDQLVDSIIGTSEQIETSNDNGLSALPVDTTVSMDDDPTLNELEQQGARPDELVKVMVEQLPGNGAPEERQPMLKEGAKDGVCIDEESDSKTISKDYSNTHEPEGASIATHESGESNEEQHQEVYGEVLDQKQQLGSTECPMENGKMDEQHSGSEITEEDLPIATPSFGKPSDENEVAIERENKLIEENARLREMMEKLMEAGKEQLNVISSLTGRVKDLEKKLSRKKKVGTKWNRKAAPANSRSKSLNDVLKERPIWAATV